MPQLRGSRHVSRADEFVEDIHDKGFSRIFGIETEYGVSVTENEKPVEASQVAMMMFQPVVTRSRSTNTYLSNGARLYLDVGSHPEYATAEARTPMQALSQDLAGERIMGRLALDAQQQLRQQYGNNTTIHVFKNNTDSSGNSFGCHENYLLRRFVSLRTIERELIPFLVTRQLFTGAGLLGPEGFELSQRARFLDDAVSSATTRSRPMVNTRDEPHADPDHYRRLHVIVGDSNRSQIATWMKLATTHLVLSVIEEAVSNETNSVFEPYALLDPGTAISTVSKDITGKSSIQLADSVSGGSTSCALDIQRVYLQAAQSFVSRHAATMNSILPDAAQVLELWENALDTIDSHRWRDLSSWVDWAAKLSLFERIRARYSSKQEYAQARAQQIDFEYHDIINGVTYPALLHHGAMRSLLSEESIRKSVNTPPDDTRAALRGAFVEKALRSDFLWACDWTHISLASSNRIEAEMLDPFSATASEDYRAVMAAMDEPKPHSNW
ncbi:proteasome accessory factor PafA2 family protein [Bifidobacterium sp.]|jgi:proteasome accessory factor A|uniref:proteasome accessory factor PafA2 family protein n=1 Tax=Bifidobacterium sp. TaxID=41200 RepID=UPI0025BBF343|nr:proteasome accessory factor PafA2 family protein [Bifidobacterium sp.]MCI1635540.1 proteasome accessory factor PafA2 family protein [Bifidobacterium sp.]